MPSRHHLAPCHKVLAKKPASWHLVDSQWLAEYKKMEADHGDFTIPQDDQIELYAGKFKVGTAVTDHYQDMLKAKPSPSVTPSP